MRKMTRAALFAAAAGFAGWCVYSARNASRPVPEESTAFDYLRTLLARQGKEDALEGYRVERLRTGVELSLYLYESSPGDPCVVFVPGTSVYALLYAEFLSKLSKRGFNVVAFDPRGHGLSSGRRGSYNIGQLVEDTKNVISFAIERYGDRVAVAGSSQGGIIAFYTAAADPRLKAAVCHNLLAPDEPDNYRMTRFPELFRNVMKAMPVARYLPKELRLPVPLYLDLSAEPCELVGDLQSFMKNDPLLVTAISLEALTSLGTTPLAVPVEEIEVPVLVIHSELDNIFPEDYVRRVFERLTAKKGLVFLERRPHMVLTDYVDEVLPKVVDWLDETLGASVASL